MFFLVGFIFVLLPLPVWGRFIHELYRCGDRSSPGATGVLQRLGDFAEDGLREIAEDRHIREEKGLIQESYLEP